MFSQFPHSLFPLLHRPFGGYDVLMPSTKDSSLLALSEELKKNIQGEVLFDFISRKIYSVDASIYQIDPIGVVIPKNKEELLKTVSIAKKYAVPIIPRGAATGTTGGCIGEALIIDTSKYLNKILEINLEEKFVRCEPGVIQDQLNDAVKTHFLCLGPDTSTGNRATLGGMFGNNASGAHSIRYGKMVDHVLSTELILANGDLLSFSALSEESFQKKILQNDREGLIYNTLEHIVRTQKSEIEKWYPKIQRRVSGYNLDEWLKPQDRNISQILTGSEGTLGIATEIKVKLSPKPKHRGLCLLFFDSLEDSFDLVEFLLSFHPYSLEMMDRAVLDAGRESTMFSGRLDWLSGHPEAVLIVEVDAETMGERDAKLQKLETQLRREKRCVQIRTLSSDESMENVWALRKGSLGLLMSRRTEEKAVAFLEDLAVAPEKLVPFMKEFQSLLKQADKKAGFYGHAGVGCLHVRPMFNLKKQEDRTLLKELMEIVSSLILKYSGALSGEHGDGLVRSWLNEKMFGPQLFQAFKQIKSAFDPDGRMNPGKIIPSQGPLENLRYDKPLTAFQTKLDFKKEGGFSFAAEMCNGNGQCRKLSDGLMCPTYQASKDERLSTRARANALFSTIQKGVDSKEFNSPELFSVLDLCIECKGCKTECPSSVDMAKMKSEYLYHYQKKHGVPLRSKIFGAIDTINALGSKISPFSNWFVNTAFSKKVLDWMGIDSRRKLPPFAPKPFSVLLRKENILNSSLRQNDLVILFNDTYTEFNFPEIGFSTICVLQALSCNVIVPPYHCCGRPLLSKGLLDQAKNKALKLVTLLLPYAEKNIPIIGLEPSCILTLKDDYPSLIEGKDAETLASVCMTFDAFVNKKIKNIPLNYIAASDSLPKKALFHGHCFQKASSGGTSATMNVLKAIPSLEVSEINSGCCGMAGSFGYEKEHFDLSLAIAETRLFPAIRKASEDTLLIADGVSCRSQIQYGFGKTPKHLAQVLECILVNKKNEHA